MAAVSTRAPQVAPAGHRDGVGASVGQDRAEPGDRQPVLLAAFRQAVGGFDAGQPDRPGGCRALGPVRIGGEVRRQHVRTAVGGQCAQGEGVRDAVPVRDGGDEVGCDGAPGGAPAGPSTSRRAVILSRPVFPGSSKPAVPPCACAPEWRGPSVGSVSGPSDRRASRHPAAAAVSMASTVALRSRGSETSVRTRGWRPRCREWRRRPRPGEGRGGRTDHRRSAPTAKSLVALDRAQLEYSPVANTPIATESTTSSTGPAPRPAGGTAASR